MIESQEVVTPERLLAAADALLKAMESEEGQDASVNVRVGRSRFAPDDPELFTLSEYIEAMTMLIRMGFAGSPRAARSDTKRSALARVPKEPNRSTSP